MYKIGVVGDKDSVLFFKAIGMDVYPVVESETEDNRKLVDRLAREDYGIIFITEQIAETIKETVDRYNNRPVPGIILIPSGQGSLGIGLQRVKDNVERAVGINILDD
jgi:V/A-type H+-transporting ATPase subunit F